jgi:hypothetical protein
LLIIACATNSFSADTPTTYRTTPGEMLREQHVDKPELPSDWTVAKGKWGIIDGAINGDEIPEHMHHCVISRLIRFTRDFSRYR